MKDKYSIEKIKNEWLTPKEVSEILCLSGGTLGNWRRRSRGPNFYRLGGKILYRRADIEHYVELANQHLELENEEE